MAGIGKFRIPSLQEMEKNEEQSLQSLPLFSGFRANKVTSSPSKSPADNLKEKTSSTQKLPLLPSAQKETHPVVKKTDSIPVPSKSVSSVPNLRATSDSLTKPNLRATSDSLTKSNLRATSDNLTKPNLRATSDSLTKTNLRATSDSLTKPNLRATSDSLTKPNLRATADNLTKPNFQATSDNLTKPNLRATSDSLTKPNLKSNLGDSSNLISADKQTNTYKDNPLKSSTPQLPTPATKPSSNSIIVNPRQRGNPILKGIRSVPWEFGNIIPDYEMGKATCALFLSLRYHQLHSEYIHGRLETLGKRYDLRVMLVLVDVKDSVYLLKDLAKISILSNCTLILAFSPEEAGRYLETYKVYENKPADAIMEKSDNDYMSMLTDCLTSVKSVNKTDCANLITNFKSLEAIMRIDRDSLSFCPGLGPRKAQQLFDVFNDPFLRKRKRASDEKPPETSPKK